MQTKLLLRLSPTIGFRCSPCKPITVSILTITLSNYKVWTTHCSTTWITLIMILRACRWYLRWLLVIVMVGQPSLHYGVCRTITTYLGVCVYLLHWFRLLYQSYSLPCLVLGWKIRMVSTIPRLIVALTFCNLPALAVFAASMVSMRLIHMATRNPVIKVFVCSDASLEGLSLCRWNNRFLS